MIVPLNSMQDDAAGGEVIAQTISKSGRHKVVLRKDDKDEKAIFMEVWNDASSRAFKSSLSVTKDVSSAFTDSVFGGIRWSKDESKICFIGEIPATASFKSPFENKKSEEDKKEEEEKKKEEEKKGKKDEKLTDETKIAGMTWAERKEKAMMHSSEYHSWFVSKTILY